MTDAGWERKREACRATEERRGKIRPARVRRSCKEVNRDECKEG